MGMNEKGRKAIVDDSDLSTVMTLRAVQLERLAFSQRQMAEARHREGR